MHECVRLCVVNKYTSFLINTNTYTYKYYTILYYVFKLDTIQYSGGCVVGLTRQLSAQRGPPGPCPPPTSVRGEAANARLLFTWAAHQHPPPRKPMYTQNGSIGVQPKRVHEFSPNFVYRSAICERHRVQMRLFLEGRNILI